MAVRARARVSAPRGGAPRLANDGGVVLLSKKKTTARGGNHRREGVGSRPTLPRRRAPRGGRGGVAVGSRVPARRVPSRGARVRGEPRGRPRGAGELLAEQSGGAVPDASVGAPRGSSDAAADAADESDCARRARGDRGHRRRGEGSGSRRRPRPRRRGGGGRGGGRCVAPTATPRYRLDGVPYPPRAAALDRRVSRRRRREGPLPRRDGAAREARGGVRGCGVRVHPVRGRGRNARGGGGGSSATTTTRGIRKRNRLARRRNPRARRAFVPAGTTARGSRRGANETPVPPPRDASRHSSSRHSSSRHSS